METKKISIVGTGLIGGSIAKALKNSGTNFHISGFDRPDILKQALDDKNIDSALSSADEAAESDIIFLCLPTELSLKHLTELAPKIKKGSIISDVCGVKGIFDERWGSLESDGVYIGGHPMTGKEAGGYANSDPLLFENSVYIISDKAERFKGIDDFLAVIKLLGSRIRFLDPYVHDKVISRVSHLPQLVAVALVNSAGDNGDEVNFLDFAAGGFRDMTRIASSNFDIWEPVLRLNRKEIISALSSMSKNLTKTGELLESGNLKELGELFGKARIKRDEIPKNAKGFINPLFDVFVYVKDEPGVLSKLTTLLFEKDINIKDIELLKIREGTGGTFRISFESEKVGLLAKSLIENSGFATK